MKSGVEAMKATPRSIARTPSLSTLIGALALLAGLVLPPAVAQQPAPGGLEEIQRRAESSIVRVYAHSLEHQKAADDSGDDSRAQAGRRRAAAVAQWPGSVPDASVGAS